MDEAEARAIRDRALSAHIEMGKRQLTQMQARINEMMEEHSLVAREIAAMEEALAVLSEGPPATDTQSGLEDLDEVKDEATEAG